MNEEQKSAQGTRPNFPQMEEEIAEFWKKQRIFERSIEERPESKAYVFYDGPPFATGLPHPGHLLQFALKDAVPRFWTMNGYRVPRRWGWDCHGLPIEALLQKQLKLNTKKDIEEYGIDKFNQACADSVLTYVSEWKKYVERFGRWVDFDGAYRTMDSSYIESVWWAFAELWKKEMIYKDLRVSLYSPSNGTPLSNFEVAMENSYIDVEDPSITVKFPVKGQDKTFLLAWTTTPWTLPANVALAVHPEEMYVKAKVTATGEQYICGEKVLAKVFQNVQQGDVEIIEHVPGSDLQGMEYEPLFPLSNEAWSHLVAREGKKKFVVVAMDYVLMTDGTGIVHTAPAFGEEDFHAANTHGLPILMTVDDAGIQKSELSVGADIFYLDSDPLIIANLEDRGLMYRSERINHSVAIFARNNTRLMFKAQPAWYVDVTMLKPKLKETAKKINWHPGHFKQGRFGKGIETAPDWCISRSRFWGAPLPVWTNNEGTDIRVFSSIDELEKIAGVKIDRKDVLALHRPNIDDIVFTNENGEQMHRIPDVFDCWFESGSMPYASVHYPKENKEFFEANYPADFIAEAQDQTRGWFYTLHVLSTALYGKPAFQNVICTGLVMAEDGKKMSKSLKNYPDPWEIMTTISSDAVRYYLLSSPVVQAEPLNFSKKDIETVQRSLFGILWNVRAFYLMVAGHDHPEIVKPRSMHVLDRWLMARLHQLMIEMTKAMESYDIVSATRPLRTWIDDLSTWWLRRSRDRLKSDNQYEKLDALRTLREALLETSTLLAPFAPFFAERLYQDIAGLKMSVHLDKWPKAEERLIDTQLLSDMETVRALAAAAHEARATNKLPVRQALASLKASFKDAAEASRLSQRGELASVLKEEVNVEDINIQGGVDTGENAWSVELDTVITPELKRKGIIRETARHIMNLRKELGLERGDVIGITVAVADLGLRETFEQLGEAISSLVQSKAFIASESLTGSEQAKVDVILADTDVTIGIHRL
ncbi:isoleucine--tRNA ligase [Candidatus Uhrbacteria bacterium]|nr:isoleucine--tRNA ligase [Candidatus Uhrbacteria bacterium]